MSSPQVLFRKKNTDLIQIAPAPNERLLPSRFNARRVVPDKGLILYNTFTGALSVFKAAMRPRVEALLSKAGIPKSADPLVEYLLARGFLVAEGTNELHRVRYMHGRMQHRTDHMELILLASEECNFRCTYCYEDFLRGTMEPWVREAVVRWVEGQAQALRSLKIEWFGGEPLVGFEAIADIAPKVQQLCREREIRLFQTMTTNGYLLTADVFRSLMSWGITNYQITLDGSQATHDKTRILKDSGGATYETIMANLQSLTVIPGECTIMLRVNFNPDNLKYMDEHLTAMKAHFGHDPRFHMRFYPVSKWGGKNDDKLATCGVSGSDEARKLELKALESGMPADNRLDRITPGNDMSLCYAARPYSFIVGADGKLMKCTLVLDKNDYNVVGSLRPDGRPDIKLDKLAKWVAPYFEEDPSCQKCFFLPVCQGISCPLERIENEARPCPSDKLEVGRTLEAIWAADTLRRQRDERISSEKALTGAEKAG